MAKSITTTTTTTTTTGLLFLVSSFLITLSVTSTAATTTKRPHIIIVMVDDYGWNDAGFRSREMKTPNIDRLAREGVILNNSYAMQACTPSRAAFLTGVYPFHMGLQTQTMNFKNAFNNYLPLHRKLLPEYLKELGYTNHYIGKWHLGFCHPKTTPTGRGFHTFYGLYGGIGNYYTHVGSRNGYDFHDDVGLDFKVDRTARGKYSTELFNDRAMDILKKHDPSEPLFLFLSYQAVHGPLVVPKKYLSGSCMHIKSSRERRRKCAMAAAVDEGVGKIQRVLTKRGFSEDLMMLFISDNGGPAPLGASNWPLRGSKKSLWEGGTRVVTILHSNKYLSGAPFTWNGLMHIVDWLPTLVSAASKGKTKVRKVDGVDNWKAIRQNKDSARHEFVYNIDLGAKNASAIRWRNYKLINNLPGKPDGWFNPPPGESIKAKVPEKYPEFMLFDLDADPSETNDLASSGYSNVKVKKVLKIMKKKLKNWKKQVRPPIVFESVPESHPDKQNGMAWVTGWCDVRQWKNRK